MSERYKITAGSHVGQFLPLKGWDGTGPGISRGGTGHWWHGPRHAGAGNCQQKGYNMCIYWVVGVHTRSDFLYIPYQLARWLPPSHRCSQQPGVLPAAAQSLHPTFRTRPSAPHLPHPTFPLHIRCPPLKGSPRPGFGDHPAAFLGSDVPAAPHLFPCILPTNAGLLPILSLFYPKPQLFFSASFLYMETSSSSAPEFLNLTFPVAAPQPGNDFSWLSQKRQHQP